jgi:galactonate dehydratase
MSRRTYSRVWRTKSLAGIELSPTVQWMDRPSRKAFKINAPYERVEYAERDLIEGTVDVVRTARKVVGDRMHLMVDNHGRHGADTVIELWRRLREYSPLFYEEPTRPDNVKVLARVAAAQTGVPLATGERLFTRWGFRELIEAQAVSVIQPDICHAGGISEVRRIAAHAELYGQRLAPHNPLGPVSTAASIHLAAATPNFLMLEHCRRSPWFDDVQRGKPLQLQAGHFVLPEGPRPGHRAGRGRHRPTPLQTARVLRHSLSGRRVRRRVVGCRYRVAPYC